MAKIKFTKGELKRQRDALRQYERFLPILQLKKQQLQIEILRQLVKREEREQKEELKRKALISWAGLFAAEKIDFSRLLRIKEVASSQRNVAGVNLKSFTEISFQAAHYDLFLMPLWLDAALEALKELVSLREETKIINQGIAILRDELRITAQRVNLFEKVKIPEAQEIIRRIKIYLGDQMANAVGRCKIAKRKIEAAELFEVAA